MIRQENGTTILTGATARKFIYETFHPNEEAQERFNAFLQRFPVEDITYYKDGFSAQIPGLTAPKWPERRSYSVNIPYTKLGNLGNIDWNVTLHNNVVFSTTFVFFVPYNDAVMCNKKSPYIEMEETVACQVLPCVV